MVSQTSGRGWEYLPDTFGGVESISDAHVIRERGVFLLTDAAGNVPQGNNRGLGLYHKDTRHLSGYAFALNGSAPVVLLCTSDSAYSLEQVLGNHRALTGDGKVIGRCTVEVTRQVQVSASGLEERLRITNYNPFSVTVRPSYDFAADFADIFEVRGHSRVNPGRLIAPAVSDDSVSYIYQGVDGVTRTTRLTFDTPPAALTSHAAGFELDLAPRQSAELRLRVLLEGGLDRAGRPPEPHGVASDYARWREAFTSIQTDNEIFDKVMDRSLVDLRMLWTPAEGENGFFAAGTPWFDALFGRDSLITALQTLPFRPAIARDCLFLLARLQGERVDDAAVEEPGKILHEVREDELSAIGELPYRRYYGSVDSTPLFLLLAAEYYRWTADLASMRRLRPHLARALDWVRSYGGLEEDGYLTYQTSSPTGLRNQGWKDSENCIVHADGALCAGPIALAEVQGYVYSALLGLAPVFEALGDTAAGSRLRREAVALRNRFQRDFWVSEENLLPMALDGEGRPAAVMSSNAGQVLWSRLLTRDRAADVRDRLFSNDMFTGWGIRTLSADSPAFNPVGYHLGTIWPHDSAIIAAGLRRYGFVEEVNEVATALFDAACAFPSYRLPEVFGGHPRSMHQAPVPYPVACRPQAWAAGSMLHLLASILGLAPDAPNGRLYLVRPNLPYWLSEVRLRGLQVGRGSADITFKRVHGTTRARVEAAHNLTVVPARTWPSA